MDVLEKVREVITTINGATCVEEVICTLHSLAALLFPIDSLSILGSIGEKYKDEILAVKAPSEDERKELWRNFYRGAAFPALARVLLYDVASNWLACFSISSRKNVYDVFFVNGHVTEVIQAVVPCMQHSGGGIYDVSALCSNAERLLVLCLLENDGVFQMVKEFAFSNQHEELTDQQLKHAISHLAQLVTSIPDKARPGASISLSSHLFFKRIASQLLAGVEEWSKNISDGSENLKEDYVDFAILFTGETFSRICRRGSSDVILGEVIPQVLSHVRSCLYAEPNMNVAWAFKIQPALRFWSQVIEAIKDSYAVERISEQVLHHLVAQNASDVEAYWILSILFHRTYKQKSIRSMFVDKFLFWKVFPICCLRWIIHFAIAESTPDALGRKACNVPGLADTVRRLVVVWSKQEFLQSARLEQQVYITAALGLCLEKMSKDDLDVTKDAIPSILHGVSCRLGSPDNLIRKMASSIALAFSRIIDPKNPLYLDDSCHEENIDWEFGLDRSDKSSTDASHDKDEDSNKVQVYPDLSSRKELHSMDGVGMGNNAKYAKKKASEFKLVDPDEVIDPATLNCGSVSDGEDDDVASENSETSSDSSLQPYDLTDDDTDLKRKFSQLVDVVAALRKSDDADAAESALNIAEKIIRASPDELKYIAGDLVRTLVQVRCSDFTVEGEEGSAEEKRQKALVALIVTHPPESLETLHHLLYSPNLDVSQRIMILDVMTDAAMELANTRILKQEDQNRPLISSMSDQPWFVPRSIGHPGASLWKEISTPGTPLKWSYSYERELSPKPGHIKRGKTRRWSLRSSVEHSEQEWSQNQFPQYAAAFMLPAMQGFDKKRQGVDLLGRDFIVMGKLIYMLGVCIKCAAMHPEASVLASPLLDMLSSREVSYHAEAYVRRSVLFAASCTLVALHPSFVASALVEGNAEISKGLEWVRTWAHHIAESDTDRDCYTLAMTCLKLHSEMALQTSRALESTENTISARGIGLPIDLSKGIIKIPHGNIGL